MVNYLTRSRAAAGRYHHEQRKLKFKEFKPRNAGYPIQTRSVTTDVLMSVRKTRSIKPLNAAAKKTRAKKIHKKTILKKTNNHNKINNNNNNNNNGNNNNNNNNNNIKTNNNNSQITTVNNIVYDPNDPNLAITVDLIPVSAISDINTPSYDSVIDPITKVKYFIIQPNAEFEVRFAQPFGYNTKYIVRCQVDGVNIGYQRCYYKMNSPLADTFSGFYNSSTGQYKAFKANKIDLTDNPDLIKPDNIDELGTVKVSVNAAVPDSDQSYRVQSIQAPQAIIENNETKLPFTEKYYELPGMTVQQGSVVTNRAFNLVRPGEYMTRKQLITSAIVKYETADNLRSRGILKPEDPLYAKYFPLTITSTTTTTTSSSIIQNSSNNNSVILQPTSDISINEIKDNTTVIIDNNSNDNSNPNCTNDAMVLDSIGIIHSNSNFVRSSSTVQILEPITINQNNSI